MSWYTEFGQTRVVRIEQARSQTWIGRVSVWNKTKYIVEGEREPYSASGRGQWEKGDTIRFLGKIYGYVLILGILIYIYIYIPMLYKEHQTNLKLKS